MSSTWSPKWCRHSFPLLILFAARTRTFFGVVSGRGTSTSKHDWLMMWSLPTPAGCYPSATRSGSLWSWSLWGPLQHQLYDLRFGTGSFVVLLPSQLWGLPLGRLWAMLSLRLRNRNAVPDHLPYIQDEVSIA